MQTSIPVFALCAVVLGAGAPALTAQDKPIQAGVITNQTASGYAQVQPPGNADTASKLESALHQRLLELGAQTAPRHRRTLSGPRPPPPL